MAGLSLEADRDILASRSGYFNRLLSGTYNNDKDGEVTIEEEDYESFSLLIETLSADTIEYTPKKVEKLFPLAHKYQCQLLLSDIEHYIIRTFSLISEDSLLAMIDEYQDLIHLKKRLETYYLSKKLTSKNSDTLTQLAQTHHFDELLKKCKTYHEERALQALRGEINEDPELLLKKCLNLFDDEEKEGLIEKRNQFYQEEALNAFSEEIAKDPIPLLKKCFDLFDDVEKNGLSKALKDKLELNTFKVIFSIAKEHDTDLMKSCLDYVDNHKQSFKEKELWELHKTPKEIQEILYPEVVVQEAEDWEINLLV